MSTLFFNLVLGFAGYVCSKQSEDRTPLRFAWSLLFPVGLVALFLSMAFSLLPWERHFALLRFFAWAVFLHGPILMLVIARRSGRKKPGWLLGSLTIALALVGVAVDAFLIEPHWLEINRITIESAKITKPTRLVLIADIQTDRVGEYEREVMERVMEQKPDMIFFAGDYIQADPEAGKVEIAALATIFEEVGLSAPLGIYAVGGNTDNEGWERVFDKVKARTFSIRGSEYVGEMSISGLTEDQSFNTRLRITPSHEFRIVLGHAPDFALNKPDVDLILAGHCHGGQVRLPFIGPLMTLSRVSRAWAAGVTEIDEDTTLVVSRGIGMERGRAPRLRFLCRPELVVIDLVPVP